jgi:hypothetical protein
MNKDLEVSHTRLSLYHRLFIYETDDTHLASALRACKGIDFPHLFDAFTPHQLWYSLWLVVTDIDDFAVFDGLVLIYPLLFLPLFLFFLSPRILFEYQPYIRVN